MRFIVGEIELDFGVVIDKSGNVSVYRKELNMTLPQMLREYRIRILNKSLDTTNGNVSAAAKLLGISHRSMCQQISKYGLSPDAYRARKRSPDAPGLDMGHSPDEQAE